MSDTEQKKAATDRLVHAYEKMMERVHHAIRHAEQETLPAVQRHIDHARDLAVELGELTRDEAERIGAYLRRDLGDAAHYLSETGHELGEWLKFDLRLIEDRLANALAEMVDHTQLELARLELLARTAEQWHTGEIAGVGTLRCAGCGKELHFHRASRIPPCPACHGSVFERVSAPAADDANED